MPKGGRISACGIQEQLVSPSRTHVTTTVVPVGGLKLR